MFSATQKRVDRLVVQNRDKDLTIEDLEKKVVSLEQTVKDVSASSAKAGLNEIRESIQRDKDMLKRVLNEYDSLTEKHEKTKGHVYLLEEKLAESQGELSEANITKGNLETSLREVLGNQSSCRRIVERSSRRTWEQPTNFSLITDKIRVENNIKEDRERLKYDHYKESTRRFSNRAERDEMVDLSSVKPSDVVEGRRFTKYPNGSKKMHDREYEEEDSLVCAYCNQLYKKGCKS
ncbi:uncharacterized protein LOC114533047 isoform X2 [Dendronephthya gigantea]|uniref:uncharacterized protein LOC114533047 isoform X2 n=1 Tax=Dendronephthya gigantea TaxID=151771 RepID=UPI00106B6767|nr:uncharacterized protein LOC114533047 isoform X2 [Dendronephthya gigantea]